jgi:hypothetical protein
MGTRLRIIFLLLIFFAVFLIGGGGKQFELKFDPELISMYKNSQDIPHEVVRRVYLSDSDIYIASGYLYVQGSAPTLYNFQHPPAIKYLYGLSIKLFNNPFWVQMYFASGVIIATFYLSYKLLGSYTVSCLSALFLIIDPVMREVTRFALLDLGQAFFFLALIILLLRKGGYVMRGVTMGLLFSSKFYGGAFIMVVFIYAYKMLVLRQPFKKSTVYSFIIAAVVFNMIYFASFLDGSSFNPVLHQLKVVNFMLTHNFSSEYFSTLRLFFSGSYNTWWGSGETLTSEAWSIFWPVGLVLAVFLAIKHRSSQKALVYFLPCIYFLVSSTQLPFTRYFIFILPMAYIAIAETVVKVINYARRIIIDR